MYGGIHLRQSRVSLAVPSIFTLGRLNPTDRHLADFTSPTYKDDITFDQWVLLKQFRVQVMKNGCAQYLHFRLHARDVSMIDCQRRFDWTQLVVAASNRNRQRVYPKFQLNLPRVKRGDRERNLWLAKMGGVERPNKKKYFSNRTNQ